MLDAASRIAIHCRKNGRAFVLDRDDCREIINALIRINALEFNIVQIPDRYSSIQAPGACAYNDCGSRGDQVIWVEIDANHFHSASPRGEGDD